MLLYYDDSGVVRAVTDRPLITNLYKFVDVDPKISLDALGKRLKFRSESGDGMRLAVICNWGDACGIATYSKYLVDALTPKVASLKIFAEATPDASADGYDVDFCWRRGESMKVLAKKVIEWGPSVVLIQHEFGIFPNASYWMQLLQFLDGSGIPVATTMHSVYEHLDKTVCSSAAKNIIVHSDTGKACLRRLGHKNHRIEVIPHGCVTFDDVKENWNITHRSHAIMQFGFGFRYKGVEEMLDVLALLKKRHPQKYADIHYLYLCSESPHVRNVINNYYQSLMRKIESLDLVDNAMIIRGFQTDEILNNYLRTYKLAIFPYITDPHNVVYGASGAVRLAMANRIPTIASSSRMFDDIDGVLPRPHGVEAIAREIDKVFSSEKHKQTLIQNAMHYVQENSWPRVADRYQVFLRSLLDEPESDAILV